MNEKSNKTEVGVTADFDFDLWERLARLDPAEFERQRELAITRFIETVGNSREDVEALRGRIESMRDRDAAPMENLQWLIGEMIRSFDLLAKLQKQHAQQGTDLMH